MLFLVSLFFCNKLSKYSTGALQGILSSKLLRKTLHIVVELGMGDGGINLRCPDVLVAEQLADCLNGDALRQRNGCGEGMTGGMERDRAQYAGPGEQPTQADVAPSVARQPEDRFFGIFVQVFGQNGRCNIKKADIYLRASLAASRAYPGPVRSMPDIRGLKATDINIGKSRETAEQECVKYKPLFPADRIELHEAAEFGIREIIAHDGAAVQLVSREKIACQTIPVVSQHEDMFQSDHVNPYGILFMRDFMGYVTVEFNRKILVELAERDVAARISDPNVRLEQFVNAFIFI